MWDDLDCAISPLPGDNQQADLQVVLKFLRKKPDL